MTEHERENSALDPEPAPESVVSVSDIPADCFPLKGRRFSWMKWVRRIHLYSGLLLLPWILLYGVTALLFNHPSWFDGATTAALPAESFAHPAWQAFPSASELADGVLAELRDRADGDADGEGEAIGPPVDARFSGPLYLRAETPETSHSASVDVEDRSGEVCVTPRDRDPTGLRYWPRDGVPLRTGLDPTDAIAAWAETHFGDTGGPVDAYLRFVPRVQFTAEYRGAPWHFSYDLQKGVLTGTPSDATFGRLGLRDTLTQMHLAHGYPASDSNVLAVWAVIVDLMAWLMIFWGLSGLLIWWRQKRLRFWGGVALATSILAATGIGLSMARVLGEV